MSTRTCPICSRPLGAQTDGDRYAPFCSKRCADVDLQLWFSGRYAIPAETPGPTANPDSAETD